MDDVPLAQEVLQETTHLQSLNLSAEELELAKGRKAAEVIASLFRETLSQQEIERLTREPQILRRERLASTDIVRPIPGSNEFLLVLGKSGVKRILATDAPAANVEAIFSKSNLFPYF